LGNPGGWGNDTPGAAHQETPIFELSIVGDQKSVLTGEGHLLRFCHRGSCRDLCNLPANAERDAAMARDVSPWVVKGRHAGDWSGNAVKPQKPTNTKGKSGQKKQKGDSKV